MRIVNASHAEAREYNWDEQALLLRGLNQRESGIIQSALVFNKNNSAIKPEYEPITTHTESSPREVRATLGAGIFSNGVWDMLNVVIPLYAVSAGFSPAEIGLIISARSVLPAALSVHGGILMDRWGVRRVVLWVAIASAVLPLFYPPSGGFATLIVLQLLLGLASSLAMSGAQTWSLQASGGDTAALARFSVASRIGTFIGPVLVGSVWDAFGAWAAFACISLVACGLVASATVPGPVPAGHPVHSVPAHGRRINVLAGLLPSWSDHVKAFALAGIPAIAFVLLLTFLRNGPGSIQSSFYIVYLGDAGFNGTMIGLLIGLCELAGVFGSMTAASMERRTQPHWLLIVCIASSLFAISITPLIGQFAGLLMAASALRGFGQGVSQPVLYSLLSKAISREVQGATVGLRNTVTRFASIVTPALMGVIAGSWGIEASFYVMGLLLLTGCAALAVLARRMLRAVIVSE